MWRNYPRWSHSPGITQRLGVIALVTASLVMGSKSVAHAASSFYWYGEGDSTCWQTGAPGSPSSACDSVGAGYLNTSSHQVEGGITAQIGVSTSGDYCGYYRLGDGLTSPDASNESANTGYATPTPYSSYQESDGHQNVCQASGSHWGQEVRDSAPGNGCTTTCGMNHYVSFGSQGTNDRPWSSLLGEPTLVVSSEARPQVLNRTGSGTNVGGWGYVCPVLKDTTTGNVLEYCLQEWRSKYNSSEWSKERVGTCAGNGSIDIDTIQSFFDPGTQFVTERAGSANTFVFESEGWRHFEGGITQSNLVNAINADNTTCGRHESTNPAAYALIGVEQGLEGWRELSMIGGSTANLQLRTEYTPLAPEVTTGAASETAEEKTTLNGRVTPYTDTHYYFEYGPTTSYGSTTSEVDIGEGTESKAVSAMISGLWPATTYHYRLVARNSAGTSYGGDQVVETYNDPTGSAALYRLSEGDLHYFFRGASGEISDEWMSSFNNEWHPAELGGSAVGNPSAFYRSSNGDLHVMFRGTDGAIYDEWMAAVNNEWHTSLLGGSAESNPSGLYDPTNGDLYAFYKGTNGQICAEWMSSFNNEWHTADLGGSAVGNPSAFYRSSNGDLHVMFRGTNGAIYDEWMSASNNEWHTSLLGGSAESDPSGLYDPANGDLYAFYKGTNGQIWAEWMSSFNNEWHTADLGGSAVGNPSAFYRSSNGDLHVMFRGTNDAIYDEWMSASNNEWHTALLGGSAESDPSGLYDPTNGDLYAFYKGTNGQRWAEWMSSFNNEWHTADLE
jgi:hypothetical protein